MSLFVGIMQYNIFKKSIFKKYYVNNFLSNWSRYDSYFYYTFSEFISIVNEVKVVFLPFLAVQPQTAGNDHVPKENTGIFPGGNWAKSLHSEMPSTIEIGLQYKAKNTGIE